MERKRAIGNASAKRIAVAVSFIVWLDGGRGCTQDIEQEAGE
jgi:hypothetical protein